MIETNSTRAPIIIIGAHRSGTTLVTQILESLGVFFGKKKDVNNEALFFLKFNGWLMGRSGATWDHPEPTREIFSGDHSEDARVIAKACAANIIRSPYTLSYLGHKRFLRQRRLDRLEFPWGWKDPRNTFTLPVWQDCFPGAKVIHVMRHGVDVAQSLTVRHLAAVAAERRRWPSQRWRYMAAPYRDRYFDTVVCRSLEGSFCVWETYLAEAQRQAQQAGSSAMELRFEDLVSHPKDSLEKLAKFCEINTSTGMLQKTASEMRADRVYAYKNDPRLQEFAHVVADRLAIYKYSSDL